MTIGFLLLLAALVCFLLATFNVSLGSLNLVALGLALWVLTLLLGTLEGLSSSTLLIVVVVALVIVVLIVLVQRGTFNRTPPAK